MTFTKKSLFAMVILKPIALIHIADEATENEGL